MVTPPPPCAPRGPAPGGHPAPPCAPRGPRVRWLPPPALRPTRGPRRRVPGARPGGLRPTEVAPWGLKAEAEAEAASVQNVSLSVTVSRQPWRSGFSFPRLEAGKGGQCDPRDYLSATTVIIQFRTYTLGSQHDCSSSSAVCALRVEVRWGECLAELSARPGASPADPTCPQE